MEYFLHKEEEDMKKKKKKKKEKVKTVVLWPWVFQLGAISFGKSHKYSARHKSP